MADDNINLKDSLDDAAAFAGIFSELKSAVGDFNKNLQQSQNPLSAIDKSFKAQTDFVKQINKVSKDNIADSKVQKNLQEGIKKIKAEITGLDRISKGLTSDNRRLTRQIGNLEAKKLSATKAQQSVLQQQINSIGEVISENQTALNITNSAIENSKKIVTNYKELGKVIGHINEGPAKIFGTLSKTLGEFPVLGKFIKAPFEAASKGALNAQKDAMMLNKGMNKATDYSKKGYEKMFGFMGKNIQVISKDGNILYGAAAKKALEAGTAVVFGANKNLLGMVAGIREMGESISQAMGPLAIFAFLVKTMLELNKATTEMQRTMGLSADEAEAYKSEIIDAAFYSNDTAISYQKMLKSMSELNAASGIMNKRSTDTLETFTKLTAKIGLSSKEAFKFERMAKVTGEDFEKQRKESAAAGVNLARSNGIMISGKKVMQDIANTTGQVAANLGNNPIAIGEAVAAAQILGTTLQKVASIGNSLLNFEQSISNEMEAELLTGKALNLERARALALAGDHKGLAEELTEQVGSLAEYQDMNVIAQQKMAQALGMNADEMGEMLIQQEYQNASAEELRALGYEDLAQKMEARNLQQQMGDLVEKVQTIIVSIAEGPLGTIAGFFSDMLSSTTAIYMITGALAGLYGGKMIRGVMMLIKAKRAEKALSFGSAVVDIVKGAWGALGGLPIIGPILALAAIGAGIGYLSSQSKKADDMMSPGTGGSGYGSRTLLGPEGAIALNNKDTVIAGTNLFDKGDDVIPTGAGSLKMPTPQPQPINVTVESSTTMDLFPSAQSVASVQVPPIVP